MRKKENKQTIYAFIDSQNLNLGIRDQGWILDFFRFRNYLKDKYKVAKAFLFIGYIPKNQRLYRFLERSGYILIFKPVLESNYKNKARIKGNVDAELVLQSMIEFYRYNKALIVTGDGDFYCLVKYLKSKKKLGRLIVPNRAKYSKLLYKFNNDIDYLSNLKYKLRLKKREVLRSRTKP